MKRAAIYARYSSDLSNERSIEDQLELCSAFARRQGWRIVEPFYSDAAMTGSTRFGRTGFERLVADALAGRFNIILAEELERLSRNQADTARLHELMEFAGVEIYTVIDGLVTEMHVGLKGTMSALFLKGLALKIRRGQAGVVRSGRAVGSVPYGYRVLKAHDEHGEPIRGLRAIEASEAEIVRRIFKLYAEGSSPRAIAALLNREHVPAPNGRIWNASTINGFEKRSGGILRNELYAGRIVWNKVRKARNPETGRRVSRPNAMAERQISDAAHLRIVDEETWAAVQARLAARRIGPPHQHRRPKHLLSGLLKCGACGSGYTVKDRDRTGKTRIQCSAVLESGSCSNRRILYLPAVERAVVDGMRDQLRDPRLIQVYVKRYNDRRRQLAREADRDRSKLEARVAAAEREYTRVFEGYVKGFVSEAEAESRLPALRAEKERLEAEARAADAAPKVIALHPGLVDDYLRQVEELSTVLAASAREPESVAGRRLAQIFRGLIESVTIYPFEARQGFEVEVKGRLAELIGPEAFPAGRAAIVGDRWCRKRGSNSRPPHYECEGGRFFVFL